ncbi:hypothetical protein HBH98_252910 [Parastagonospora nodorum]|uniref:Uncharacterized protein n=1 Tax=Phaeosphaeria nodorum (strain SN15 / ATCC MYA-4574 / FGSC 10173) TaxID=321614 RepID=A0A7U2ET27_PHANO|nr:hypothetical protein HBI10_105040 [Parastagonospora nodorum]QRC92167.1 hypothetical protein JI435_402030 [Parastagonospora nodorum SN15]KAH4017715.1 hypothetical protein HBI09_193470 [Parastagonospora nodorum]KAH4051106.1 hypothetical protein HBH49_113270 [Parastagonospora nodorum]KAH4073881.1 hypothetical protein HBH50_039610 [Parastagonospora nodorum]
MEIVINHSYPIVYTKEGWSDSKSTRPEKANTSQTHIYRKNAFYATPARVNAKSWIQRNRL